MFERNQLVCLKKFLSLDLGAGFGGNTGAPSACSPAGEAGLRSCALRVLEKAPPQAQRSLGGRRGTAQEGGRERAEDLQGSKTTVRCCDGGFTTSPMRLTHRTHTTVPHRKPRRWLTRTRQRGLIDTDAQPCRGIQIMGRPCMFRGARRL